MGRIFWLFITILFLINTRLAGQQKQPISSFFCTICKTGVHPETPPYDFKFNHEWPFLATGVILLSSGLIAQQINHPNAFTQQELDLLDRDDILPFDRGATSNWSPKSAKASDIVRTTSVLLPVFFLMNHHTKKDISVLLMMSLEVFSTNFGLTLLAKNIVNRPRPFTYNTNLDFNSRSAKNDKLSFFSGHTSHTAAFTFFIAKVVTDYHPYANKNLKTIIWSGAVLIPMATGYLRIRAGKHFPTDVIVGYMVGASIGYLVPHLHKVKSSKLKNLSLLPAVYGNGGGVTISYSF